jgi:ribonuclease HI
MNSENTIPILRFDGGSRGNPGKSGCGFVIHKSKTNDTQIYSDCCYLGDNQTNNYAEYNGIIMGLEKAIKLNIKSIIIEGDSLLVINQLLGKWKVKSENIKILHEKADNLLKMFDYYTLTHIPRSKNKIADELANNSMDNQ